MTSQYKTHLNVNKMTIFHVQPYTPPSLSNSDGAITVCPSPGRLLITVTALLASPPQTQGHPTPLSPTVLHAGRLALAERAFADCSATRRLSLPPSLPPPVPPTPPPSDPPSCMLAGSPLLSERLPVAVWHDACPTPRPSHPPSLPPHPHQTHRSACWPARPCAPGAPAERESADCSATRRAAGRGSPFSPTSTAASGCCRPSRLRPSRTCTAPPGGQHERRRLADNGGTATRRPADDAGTVARRLAELGSISRL